LGKTETEVLTAVAERNSGVAGVVGMGIVTEVSIPWKVLGKADPRGEREANKGMIGIFVR